MPESGLDRGTRCVRPPSAPHVVLLTLLAALTLVPASLHASPSDPVAERPVLIGITLGIRTFPEELGLDDSFSFGGRVGLGLGRRWNLLLDFVAAHTTRTVTSRVVYVDALRAVGRYHLATGGFRPYAMAGVGGVLFMFQDAATTAGGTLTFGVGADQRIAPRTRLFLEASTDVYSQEEFTYNIDGGIVRVGPQSTETLGTISLGVCVEF